MKKARIMLIAIAVLATVGGALAFNVQKFGNKKYCYTTVAVPLPTPGLCTISTVDASFTPTVANKPVYYYTITTDENLCTLATCTFSASTIIDL